MKRLTIFIAWMFLLLISTTGIGYPEENALLTADGAGNHLLTVPSIELTTETGNDYYAAVFSSTDAASWRIVPGSIEKKGEYAAEPAVLEEDGNGGYRLTLPYFQYNDRFAYSAVLSTSDSVTWSIVPGSIESIPIRGSSSDPI